MVTEVEIQVIVNTSNPGAAFFHDGKTYAAGETATVNLAIAGQALAAGIAQLTTPSPQIEAQALYAWKKSGGTWTPRVAEDHIAALLDSIED